MHIATHKLPLQMSAKNGVKVKSFNVVRAIWRSVTGDLGGNIDQVRRKRWSRHSTARMAAYLSKYMLKAFEDGDQWSNRYSASAGVEIPDAVVTRWRGERLADLIGLVYDECSTGAVDITTGSLAGATCFICRLRGRLFRSALLFCCLEPSHLGNVQFITRHQSASISAARYCAPSFRSGSGGRRSSWSRQSTSCRISVTRDTSPVSYSYRSCASRSR